MLSNVFTPKIVNLNDVDESHPRSDNIVQHDRMSFREISCDTDVISGASGSAFVSFGDTKVFCAVYGPRANQRGAVGGPFSDSGLLECDVRIATSNSQLLSSYSETRISQQVRDAIMPSVRLSCYPKAVISISAVIVQSGGSELSALISCASLALADASIEINDFVCAATVGISKCQGDREEEKSVFTVDPCMEEYDDLISVLTLSSMVSCGPKLTHLSVDGSLSTSEFAPLWEIAQSGCIYLRSVFIDCMKRRQRRLENIT